MMSADFKAEGPRIRNIDLFKEVQVQKPRFLFVVVNA